MEWVSTNQTLSTLHFNIMLAITEICVTEIANGVADKLASNFKIDLCDMKWKKSCFN